MSCFVVIKSIVGSKHVVTRIGSEPGTDSGERLEQPGDLLLPDAPASLRAAPQTTCITCDLEASTG